MKLLLNSELFEYDIRGLLMAFYPKQKFETDEAAADPDFLRMQYEACGDGLMLTMTLSDDGKVTEDALKITPEKDRAAAKTAVKQALYRLLSGSTGKTLPWGTLTGIRPTKIPMAMLKEGASDEAIRAHMEDVLYCSPGKTALATEIARRELALLNTIDAENGYSLYVGIPFCPSICLYCSFSSFALSAYRNMIWDYLHAVVKELAWVQEHFAGKPLNSVYFGGGTPTTLSAEQLDFLCHEIVTRFDLSEVREWTVEAGRPDSVTEEKLEVLKKYPVTRISVNPQTMHQKTLNLIGRRHTVDEVLETYRMARAHGFDNINMDLIVGLPGETKADVEETIRRVVELDPDNVTIHSLALKRAARLNMHLDEYEGYLMENSDETMDMCREYLKTIGEEPYYLYRQKNMAGNQENVGYARPGKEGVYNILIMEEVQTIVACGAGTVTKRVFADGRIERCDTVKEVRLYIEKIDEMIARKARLFE